MTATPPPPDETRRQAWIYLGVGIVSIPLGIFLLWFFGGDLRRQKSVPTWPSVRGTLTSVDIRKLKIGGRQQDVLLVDYAYLVGDKTHTSRRFHLGSAHAARPEGSSRSLDYGSVPDPQAWARLHPKGSPIEVWYDPTEPDYAVLDATPTIGASSLLFGAGFLLAAVLLIAGGIRRFRRLRPQAG